MIAACATHIPLPKLPAHVIVIRDGHPLTAPPGPGTQTTPGSATTPSTTTTTTTSTSGLYLQVGDQILVRRPHYFGFSFGGTRYSLRYGLLRLQCVRALLAPNSRSSKGLRVVLQYGRLQVFSGSRPQRAAVLSREMLAFPARRGTKFIVERNQGSRRTQAWTLDGPIVVAKASDQRLRINARITYTAISDAKGLRLDIWPFSISPLQRPTTRADGLPAFWADGLPCSVGCTPSGVTPGWPLKPFDQQHAIRAGINELRTANFHVAVDIQAQNFQPVYAIQSGYASIRYPGTGDVNVDVGDFYYWHINPTVSNGQYVTAYKTVIGNVLFGFYHVALSQGNTSDYLNPLRPGGSLRPYTDREPPMIGTPQIFPDGRAIVSSFDPQSFVARGFPYETPVLAPSSLAWRLYDSHNRALTGLQWAMRGSQNYPPSLKPVIFAPGAANPGFQCFFTQRRCIPNWVYWLAGGITPRLPLSSLAPGRYRLTVYAWDWAGNTSALDYGFTFPLAHPARTPNPEFGPLAPSFEYDEIGAAIAPPSHAP